MSSGCSPRPLATSRSRFCGATSATFAAWAVRGPRG
jgi:hypothetical protein